MLLKEKQTQNENKNVHCKAIQEDKTRNKRRK